MLVVVCIKQVPSSTKVKINPETNTLMRDQAGTIVNPFDEFAVEEAVRVVERHGGEAIALSMGPPQAEEALRAALEQGCDRAYLVSDRAFAGADTLATSHTLAAAIKKIEAELGKVDLIICGKQAIDGDTGQVGPSLAVRLGIPPLSYVSKIIGINLEAGKITAERSLEDGKEVVRSDLPAVLTVLKNINIPRYPSLLAKRKAKQKSVDKLGLKDLDLPEEKTGLKGSPTWVVRIFTPEARSSKAQIYTGEPSHTARLLADRIMEIKCKGKGEADG
ncbi:electron transfer flavoprotein subunit beta/FixA family protein [bacterium]|nr:MAG: electron transfer flavoprotein subunit beta/FixA family protein [bacterium]